MRGLSFAKGHGTENDFVLVVDRENMQPVDREQVVRICDRRAGIGGDGLLRAVLAKHVDGWDGDGDLWFMDYRNADGSIAEMCGNGVRVFVRYLVDEGLAYGPVVPVATRAGVREAELLPDGRIRVAMGPVVVAPEAVRIVTADGTAYSARPVDVGNPHAVSFTDDLSAVWLQTAPDYPHRRLPRRSERGIRPAARRATPRHAGVRAWVGGDTHPVGPVRSRPRPPLTPSWLRPMIRARRSPSPRPTGSTCSAGRSRWSWASRRT